MKPLLDIKLPSVLGLFSLIAVVLSPKANAGWEVEWIDKFDGTSVNWQNWTAQVQANYNNEIQCYTDDETSPLRNLEVSDGTLKIIAHKKQVSCQGLGGQSRSWTSARLNSKDKREFLYGRIETRLKFNTLDGGVWPAFWALENRIAEHPFKGDNDTVHWPNPGAGEIDIWEWFSNQGDSYITNFFNISNCGSEFRPPYPGGANDVLDFHVYAMEWTEHDVRFYMNDNLVQQVDIRNCAQYKEPMFLLVNLAIGGNLGGAVDPALTTATLEVDYIAHCSASNSNALKYCNEQSPVAPDSDSDGVSDNLDKCPGSEATSDVDMNGCKSQPILDAPSQSAPTPTPLQENVIAIFSDEYNAIGGVNFAPGWGQSTNVSTEVINGNQVLKYQGLNYQGTAFENNPQDVSNMDYVHVDYWVSNATALSFYLISPGPAETHFDFQLVTNQWQSVDIPLTHFSNVNLQDVFQLKFVGNGTVFLDNIYFYQEGQTNDSGADGDNSSGTADTDSDGVSDDEDQCPNSTSSNVDNIGCEVQAENQAPSLTLTLIQNGRIISDIDPNGGMVTLHITISDADSNDQHTFTWDTSGFINGTQSNNAFEFDPSLLSSGEYQISVSVQDDGSPMKSADLTFNFSIEGSSKDSSGSSTGSALLVLSLLTLRARKRRFASSERKVISS